MEWKRDQINNHKQAARILGRIINESIQLIKNNKDITEFAVQQFILRRFKFYNLVSGKFKLIVAFGKNTSFVHYYPQSKSRKLTVNSLIMIDIWARFNKNNSPFADVTWMLYYGKTIPPEQEKIFNLIIKARNKAINIIKENLKRKKLLTGQTIDAVARNIIDKAGYKINFLHSTGHPLGFNNPHGRGRRIYPRCRKELYKNLAYTIEPGVYFKNKFGIRSEINFYIDDKYNLIITTEVQNKIVRISPIEERVRALRGMEVR